MFRSLKGQLQDVSCKITANSPIQETASTTVYPHIVDASYTIRVDIYCTIMAVLQTYRVGKSWILKFWNVCYVLLPLFFKGLILQPFITSSCNFESIGMSVKHQNSMY